MSEKGRQNRAFLTAVARMSTGAIIRAVREIGRAQYTRQDHQKAAKLLRRFMKLCDEDESWGSLQDCRSLMKLGSVFDSFLTSEDDRLVRVSLRFLKYLARKQNSKLIGFFDKILSSVSLN